MGRSPWSVAVVGDALFFFRADFVCEKAMLSGVGGGIDIGETREEAKVGGGKEGCNSTSSCG